MKKALCFGIISISIFYSQLGFTTQSPILEKADNISNRANNLLYSQNSYESAKCAMEACETLKYLKKLRVVNKNNHVAVQKYKRLDNITDQLMTHLINLNGISA